MLKIRFVTSFLYIVENIKQVGYNKFIKIFLNL